MRCMRILFLSLLVFVTAQLPAAETPLPLVTTGTLLDDMANLDRLARWPQPAFRTVQFSSYDRRSTGPEAPGWFSNADGFGREPVAGFQKVLRPAAPGKPGLYLMAEVNGPGAIVRGWSAGMDGVLRVHIDPTGDADSGEGLVWEGKAYDFLARRSEHYARLAGVELEAGDAFVQQDADYLPVPFARRLRVTWEGTIDQLHFYHLQVRIYPEGTKVRGFSPEQDLKEFAPQARAAARALTAPRTTAPAESLAFEASLPPGTNWSWSPHRAGPAAVRELRVRVRAFAGEADLAPGRLDQVLRGTLLRVFFDRAQRPQVESPLGDFFASGPGVNPFSSLPLNVEPDGTMICRFPMPYEKSVRIELVNLTEVGARVTGSLSISPWEWDDRTLYFRAKWRADHDLLAGPGAAAIDLPYGVIIGRGVFVGCAAMIMNPTGVPTAGGNWWGEGDEKFIVDGEPVPSTFGTGSEDYFNYSWSRPDLFDHPYCGQPLDSGPDTAGYVSNHRFQVLDAIPFETSFAALMELWSHRRTPGLSYARIAYHYARPGAIDDHRGLGPADLRLPVLPRRDPVAAGGASGAVFHLPADLAAAATLGRVEITPFPLATQLQVLQWKADSGARLTLKLPVDTDGRAEIHLVAVHRTDGAVVRASIGGQPLAVGDSETFALRSRHAPRVLNVNFRPVDLRAGTRDLVLECVESGLVGLDCIWIKPVK